MECVALANTVTAFSIIFTGIIVIVFCLIRPQPLQWVIVYLAMIITGIATVWYHGWGEAGYSRVADIGTNLLLVWCVQMAVLIDFYTRKTRLITLTISGITIFAFVIWTLVRGPDASRVFPITFGEYGGFTVGEILLISNTLLAVGLLAARRHLIPAPARPFMAVIFIIFMIGLLFSTASNTEVNGILAYHATWHLVAATGFFTLWAFNDTRFAAKLGQDETGLPHHPVQ